MTEEQEQEPGAPIRTRKVQIMQWVSVKDKLPEKLEQVLTWDGTYIDKGSIMKKTTHWMPLPSPPKAIEWISVKERMPYLGDGAFIAHFPEGSSEPLWVDGMLWSGAKWFSEAYMTYYNEEDLPPEKKVTHWALRPSMFGDQLA
ncbi:MAG: hypothetical protein A3F13_02745 [Gammaproteobacteria bacterium RIFCSPHIGHO2_12_FULL_40_19]|nr:MAG: hypothetical protein A3F13_02745 [Gammaproteobacteria bacterium RIFCSPHIGHO2_12_FULL_40_19]